MRVDVGGCGRDRLLCTRVRATQELVKRMNWGEDTMERIRTHVEKEHNKHEAEHKQCVKAEQAGGLRTRTRARDGPRAVRGPAPLPRTKSGAVALHESGGAKKKWLRSVQAVAVTAQLRKNSSGASPPRTGVAAAAAKVGASAAAAEDAV